MMYDDLIEGVKALRDADHLGDDYLLHHSQRQLLDKVIDALRELNKPVDYEEARVEIANLRDAAELQRKEKRGDGSDYDNLANLIERLVRENAALKKVEAELSRNWLKESKPVDDVEVREAIEDCKSDEGSEWLGCLIERLAREKSDREYDAKTWCQHSQNQKAEIERLKKGEISLAASFQPDAQLLDGMRKLQSERDQLQAQLDEKTILCGALSREEERKQAMTVELRAEIERLKESRDYWQKCQVQVAKDNDQLQAAIDRLVGFYIANRDTPHEFISTWTIGHSKEGDCYAAWMEAKRLATKPEDDFDIVIDAEGRTAEELESVLDNELAQAIENRRYEDMKAVLQRQRNEIERLKEGQRQSDGESWRIRTQRDRLQAAIDRLASRNAFRPVGPYWEAQAWKDEHEARIAYAKQFATKPEDE